MAANSAERRRLRFEAIDDALAEADRLAVAEAAGRLGRAGNWTLGQTLNHLATWADFAFDGYPASVAHPPLLVRLIARLLKRKVLTGPMMPGMLIGRLPGGTLATDDVPTTDALGHYHLAMERLRGTTPAIENPAFGPLTHEQWIALNLRHAELHLGFQIPQVATANV